MATPKSIAFLIYLLSVLCILSCEFEPESVYEAVRDENKLPPNIIVNELSFQEDTIYAYWDKLLSFNFSCSGEEEILAIRVLFNHLELEVFFDSTGSVGFSHEMLPEGPHKVKLEIYTTTGIGSIADQLQMEQFKYTTSWVLFMVKGYYGATSSVENGLLKIDWGDYIASDFVGYDIAIGLNPGYRCMESQYYAKGHMGWAQEYKIWACTESGRGVQFGYVHEGNSLPALKRSMTDSGTYIIHWNRPTYYGAIDSILLWESITWGDVPDAIVLKTNDLNDTVYHVRDVENNQHRRYNLVLIGKYPSDPFHDNPPVGMVNKSFTFFTK